ncbi:hypothetical protein AURDEDRAFT_161347 [Auricularia subglabra TFB-10046 SS5]|nr:hypothetical protein AURDEDRAFT_161347 [Auricularia subglabra TFB-10046 SS5]
MEATQSDGARTTPCLWSGCNEQFATQERLYFHLCTRHSRQDAADDAITIQKAHVTCRWKGCNQSVTCKGGIVCEIVEHFIGHTTLSLFPCGIPGCLLAFKSHAELIRHLRVVHDTIMYIAFRPQLPLVGIPGPGDGPFVAFPPAPPKSKPRKPKEHAEEAEEAAQPGPSGISQCFPCTVENCPRKFNKQQGLSLHRTLAHDNQDPTKAPKRKMSPDPDPGVVSKRVKTTVQHDVELPVPNNTVEEERRGNEGSMRPPTDTQNQRIERAFEAKFAVGVEENDVESEDDVYDPELFAPWQQTRQATPEMGGDHLPGDDLDPAMFDGSDTASRETRKDDAGTIPVIDPTEEPDETDGEKERRPMITAGGTLDAAGNTPIIDLTEEPDGTGDEKKRCIGVDGMDREEESEPDWSFTM